MSNSQTQRRMKYGLNVTIAVVAAIGVAVLINVIGYKRLFHVRFDFTATRQYSLSEQTRQVVRNLETEHRIVTLLTRTDPYIDQARDLVQEYQHHSTLLSVDHINPALDITRVDQFYRTLAERYADDLTPLSETVTAGRAAMATLRTHIREHMDLIAPLMAEDSPLAGPIRQFVQSVAQALARFDTQYEELERQLESTMADAMPSYTAAIDTLKSVMGDYDEKVFAVATDRLRRATESELPPAARNQLIRLADLFDRTRETLRAPLRQLRDAKPVAGYDGLRTQLSNPNTMVLIGPKQVRVIALGEMFRTDEQQLANLQPGEQPELRFLGEEKITGTLMSMTQTHQPLVIFVQGGQQPMVGPGGTYEQLAQRLRNMNFEVRQWAPGGRANPMTGQMMGGDMEPPTPAPGQRVVWVVPPLPGVNPMMGGQGAGIAERVANRVHDGLSDGEAAFLMLAPSPMAAFGAPDPMVDITASWGMTVKADQVIVQEARMDGRRVHSNPTISVDEWLTATPITTALRGMPGIFLSASPVTLTDAPGVTHWPLVELASPRMWASSDFEAIRAGNATYNPETAAPKFTIGAAAERDGSRVVMIADAGWATDYITTMGMLGPGTAQVTGARFPGNAELFINGVYWLAGLDSMIAASARVQDIRRVNSMSERERLAVRWLLLLGLPGITALAGVGVWMRRRG